MPLGMFFTNWAIAFLPFWFFFTPWSDSVSSWLVETDGSGWARMTIAVILIGLFVCYFVSFIRYGGRHKTEVAGAVMISLAIAWMLVEGGYLNPRDPREILTMVLVMVSMLEAMAVTSLRLDGKDDDDGKKGRSEKSGRRRRR